MKNKEIEFGRERYMFCCDCGNAANVKNIFKKIYPNTAICLCKKCAIKLAKEINEKYVKE